MNLMRDRVTLLAFKHVDDHICQQETKQVPTDIAEINHFDAVHPNFVPCQLRHIRILS